MKSVLISIKPKWCELIASGKKTVEVRKTRPMINTPFKCYIYETKGKTEIPTFIDEEGHEIYQGRGQVIGEFVCDRIADFIPTENGILFKRFFDLHYACLSVDEIRQYLGDKLGYGWHISDLVIYDEPREVSEFRKPCIYGEESERPCFTCDISAFAPDLHLYCFNVITRPPQSWCYVEEMPDE